MDVYAPVRGRVIQLRLEEAGDPTKFIVAEGFDRAGWLGQLIDFARQVDGNFDPTADYNRLIYGCSRTATTRPTTSTTSSSETGSPPETPGPTITLDITAEGGKPLV